MKPTIICEKNDLIIKAEKLPQGGGIGGVPLTSHVTWEALGHMKEIPRRHIQQPSPCSDWDGFQAPTKNLQLAVCREKVWKTPKNLDEMKAAQFLSKIFICPYQRTGWTGSVKRGSCCSRGPWGVSKFCKIFPKMLGPTDGFPPNQQFVGLKNG